MKKLIRDYLPLLREAIAEARDSGLGVEVEDLDRACSSSFTTSSEMLQEHGLAIRRFLKVTRRRLPLSTRKKLLACLNETELAGSGFRRLIATIKRTGKLC
jgi:hypothetical protein